MKNQVRKLRKQLGLTQAELAGAAKTSQQQIQRIEAGVQLARIDLAMRIAMALEAEMSEVFPGARFPLAAMKGKGPDAIPDEPMRKRFADGGIDWEPVEYALHFGFEGEHERTFGLARSEHDRLWNLLQTDPWFVTFDAKSHFVAVNVKRLNYWRFSHHVLFDSSLEEDSDTETFNAEFWFAGSSTPLSVSVEPDTEEFDAEAKEDVAPLQGLMISLAHVSDAEDVEFLIDEDGRRLFFRPHKLNMLTVPMTCVRPALYDAVHD